MIHEAPSSELSVRGLHLARRSFQPRIDSLGRGAAVNKRSDVSSTCRQFRAASKLAHTSRAGWHWVQPDADNLGQSAHAQAPEDRQLVSGPSSVDGPKAMIVDAALRLHRQMRGVLCPKRRLTTTWPR